MNKELLHKIKKELIYIVISILFFIIVFKLIFYKQDLLTAARLVLSLFWAFAIPGYFLMLYWHDKIEFRERFAIGIGLGAAVIGILSYYLGLIGINIKWHGFLLPAVIIAVGVLAGLMKKPIIEN